MNRWRYLGWCGAIALVLLVPALVQAQGAPEKTRRALTAKDQERMYEDIEIMRRLLNRQLAMIRANNCIQCHAHPFKDLSGMPAPHGVAMGDFDSDGFPDVFVVQHHAETAGHGVVSEGLYLPGQGVVFQAVLPRQFEQLHGIPVMAKAPELSEWEKVRKEIHGEKPVAAKSPRGHNFRIEDVFLKVLADNGRHFAQLAPSETITIAITFRGPDPDVVVIDGSGSMMLRGSSGGMRPPGLGGSSSGTTGAGSSSTTGGGFSGSTFPLGTMGKKPGFSGTTAGIEGLKAAGVLPIQSGAGNRPPGSQATDLELLADMYIKQGKFTSAIASYEKALAQHPNRKGELYRKLAEVYLKMGNSNEAIQKAMEYLKKIQSAPSSKTQAKLPPLPPRLIISVPKKVLDAFGGGQLSLDALRKEASIEWLRFPVTEEKKGAQLPARSSDVIRVKGGAMRIPIKVDLDRLHELESIRLLTSRDHGKTWKAGRTVAPTEEFIPFNTRKSGEVWLAVQLVRKNGSVEPRDLSNVSPALKILIDGAD
jgi:hypothetical protein